MTYIILCCPYDQRHIARAAGASWDPQKRAWKISINNIKNPATLVTIAPFLPAKFDPAIPAPWLLPNLVPQPLWGKNLRSILPQPEWNRIRKNVYETCAKRCTICGDAGSQWPVEADEVWHYDDATNTQKLTAVTGLCPSCHEVRHWGKAVTDGHRARALAHLARINNWTLSEAARCTDAAMDLWHQRSTRQWNSDYSFAVRTYGVTIEQSGVDRAKTTNIRIIADARRRHFG